MTDGALQSAKLYPAPIVQVDNALHRCGLNVGFEPPTPFELHQNLFPAVSYG